MLTYLKFYAKHRIYVYRGPTVYQCTIFLRQKDDEKCRK